MQKYNRHWVLWDGNCGFCRRSVELVARRDRRGLFRCVPYQEAPAPPMNPQLFAACAYALHVVTREGRVLRGGRACLFVFERIGLGRLARLLSYPPFIWPVEWGYALVARHRLFFSRLFFRGP